jgi:hyperosmotically inducible protein
MWGGLSRGALSANLKLGPSRWDEDERPNFFHWPISCISQNDGLGRFIPMNAPGEMDGEAKEKTMFKSPTILLLVLAVLCGNAAFADATLNESGQASRREDAKLRLVIIREARHELTLLPGYSLFDWIEFEVRPDDSVILRGQVRGLTLKADAEDAVKRIEGVTGVVNGIEDLPPSSSDDGIRRRLYRVIYAEDGPLFRYAIEVIPSIHIIVKNGNVTLKGIVDSQEDSNFAYTQARSVSGIFSVKNDLRVEKQTPEQLRYGHFSRLQ